MILSIVADSGAMPRIGMLESDRPKLKCMSSEGRTDREGNGRDQNFTAVSSSKSFACLEPREPQLQLL